MKVMGWNKLDRRNNNTTGRVLRIVAILEQLQQLLAVGGL